MSLLQQSLMHLSILLNNYIFIHNSRAVCKKHTPISLAQQVYLFYMHVQVHASCWEIIPLALCTGTFAYLMAHVTVRK